ncbi:MAG: hypothetical protein OXG11_12020, partial [Chloroflexi bacterium]|nr:hypothetical protein [Chloroflexota bacterium]
GVPAHASVAAPRVRPPLPVRPQVDIAPLPVVARFDYPGRFEPIGNFGIASFGPARSVIIKSRVDVGKLPGCEIGIIDDTATSVRLLRVLLNHWNGAKSQTRFASIDADNDAVLLIGDEALRNMRPSDEYPVVADLADEWKKATGLPFVFARWYAAGDVSDADRETVADYFDRSLTSNLSNPSAIHRRRTDPGLSLEQTGSYIRNFVYRLGDAELEGLRRFRELDSELERKVSAA